MLIKTIPVGYLETNCYVVTDEKTRGCAVIDPGDEVNSIMRYIEENDLTCGAILITHGHSDHVSAAAALQEETGASIFINEKDTGDKTKGPGWTPPAHTVFYKEGDSVKVGELTFSVIETPGHTPGCVCLMCADSRFTGDTLFRDSCGRTDLPGGSGREMLVSLKRIASLPGDYDIYPGHAGSSTLSRERRFNRYLDMALHS